MGVYFHIVGHVSSARSQEVGGEERKCMCAFASYCQISLQKSCADLHSF